MKQALAEFLEREALLRPTAWNAVRDLANRLVSEVAQSEQIDQTAKPLPIVSIDSDFDTDRLPNKGTLNNVLLA